MYINVTDTFYDSTSSFVTLKDSSRPSSDMAAFRRKFDKAKHIVVLTGAGVSAESGVPTFRGAGGLWRKWIAQVFCSVFFFWA